MVIKEDTLNITKIASFFQKNSLFCFTMDLDWAPELVIKRSLDIFEELQIPLTPFITHHSNSIENVYKGDKAKHVGLHPNFLPGSSHGDTMEEQVEYVLNLWPKARCFRSHSFYDNGYIVKEFIEQGFKYDSNLGIFLQPFVAPLRHCTGIIRFPVSWADSMQSRNNLEFKFQTIRKYLELPGLKVFDFHPMRLALNIPDDNFYKKKKFLYEEQQNSNYIAEHEYKGRGTKTLLYEIADYLKKEDEKILFLDNCYNFLCKNF